MPPCIGSAGIHRLTDPYCFHADSLAEIGHPFGRKEPSTRVPPPQPSRCHPNHLNLNRLASKLPGRFGPTLALPRLQPQPASAEAGEA